MSQTIALALSPGVPLFELAGPCGIFGVDRSDLTGTDWYRFIVCGPPAAAVDQWFTATTPYTYDDLAAADTVIVPACHDAALTPDPDLVEAIRDASSRGARIASICTGAFVLAAAGVLDGRTATTHWLHARTLAERHPLVTVDPDPLYIDHGDVLTSAGKSAGIDLCLHLVRTDYGARVANDVARRLVSAPHREGNQRQYVDPVTLPPTSDDLRETLDWAIAHLDRPITVDELARRAHVSARTLHRQFHRRMGTNPLEWLNTQRVRRAQHLLEVSDHTIDRIAEESGFGSAITLRRHMHSALGTTPDTYRRTFGRRDARRTQHA
ncbi:helix-turn-helix domain-containing protein [Pseudoclavibacter chungangensis]|uniref:Helix-turn-helix domain-containing protein n=1 Tax=Pseudoclavibacter chungangensis TaxID=587635 RepID=A0A7J5BQN3_9MICO|nr:helix-turn-helix domain-containing protein [Pseudoclavibacter chungangensis]KAB1656309.1 helix-turn-helix domain-containing protein [Pseudoclavibacter chungangensis]NYJ67073.1 transcriptional regulator GlxA family with amidase domain [Pseudoclavibacter chungangensis]